MRGVGHSRCATCVKWRTWIFPVRSYVYERRNKKRRKKKQTRNPEQSKHPIKSELMTAFYSAPLSQSALPRRPLILVRAPVRSS